jgi:hypothetical protein
MQELQGEAGDLFSTAWTRAVRGVADVTKLPEPGTAAHTCLMAIVERLGTSSIIPRPLLRRPSWATQEVIDAFLANCAESLPESRPEAINLKKNPETGKDIHTLLNDIDIAGYIGAETVLKIAGWVSSTYVVYDVPGAALHLHLDLHNFGDVNVLLCLDRVDTRPADEASSTVFVTDQGIEKFYYGPGECLIFDARMIPHGRTPVQAGEKVVLLSVGLNLVKP